LEENGPEMIVSGAKLLGKLAAGAVKAIPEVVAKIPDIVMAIVDGFAESGPEFAAIGKDIVRGVWSGIQSLASWIGGKVKGFLGNIVDGAKNILGIHSPSTVFAGMGENMVLGLEKGWDDNIDHAHRDIERGLNFGTASVDYSASAAGRFGSVVNGGFGGEPITIVVQSVLDGKVIGETAYQYSRNKERAFGW
jgi:phage-related protein